MRTFSNFFSKQSNFQVANIIPGGVSSPSPVNLFNRPTREQMKDFSSFYAPFTVGPALLHSAFSYKYFLAKWARYEYKKSYNKFFGSSGFYPSMTTTVSAFDGFVPTRRKSKFFYKRFNTTLTFKHQPMNGLKSFIKYKSPTSDFFSYFDFSDKELYSSLSDSKKIRFVMPRYRFFRNRRRSSKKSFFKKRFFAKTHRFYILNFTRQVKKKKLFIRARKFRRLFRFFRKSRRIFRRRRQWISGNFFEIFSDTFFSRKKKGIRSRIAKYFFRGKRFYRFNQYIKNAKKSARIRRKLFRGFFFGSRKKAANFLLRQVAILPRASVFKKKTQQKKVFLPFQKNPTRYFRLFSYLRAAGNLNFSYVKKFFISHFKSCKKVFYLFRYARVRALAFSNYVRQFYLFSFFSLPCSGFNGFAQPFSINLPKKSVALVVSRLRVYQRRQFVKLHRFSAYFNLLMRLMVFPRDEPEYLDLRLQFLHFTYNLTSNGKHFYLLPFLFNKNYYFGTFSLVNSDFYMRPVDGLSGVSIKALRPKVFKLSIIS